MRQGIQALKILTVILIIMLIASSAACNINEVTQKSFVTFIGVDIGVSDKWRITFIIPKAKGDKSKSGSGQDSSGEGVEFTELSLDAPSLFSAVEIAPTNTPKKISFEHTLLFVFSEDVARSGLMGEIIAPLVRNRQVRFSTNVVISTGTAEEFVRSINPQGESIARYIDELIKQSSDAGYIADLRLLDLYDCIKSTYHQPVAIMGAVNSGANYIQTGQERDQKFINAADYYAGEVPRVGGGSIELLGFAIFDGDKMVGKLTGFEARIVELVKGDIAEGIFTIPDPLRPDLVVPIKIKYYKHPIISTHLKNNRPNIHIQLDLEGDVLAIQSRIGYKKPEMTEIINKAFNDHIEKGIARVVRKTQDLNCDVMQFGHTFVRNFNTITEWEDYNWNNHYEDAKITWEVNTRMIHFGTIKESSPIIKSEGSE